MKTRAINVIPAGFLCLLALCLSGLPVFSTEAPEALFAQAIDLTERALASENSGQSGEAESEAKVLFIRAAEGFERESTSDWRLLYEAGNARWWAGQGSLAVIDYRRYLRHDPLRGEAWENLAEARKLAGTLDPGGEGFLYWPWYLWFAAAASFCIGLSGTGFGLYLLTRKAAALRASLSLLTLSLALALGSGTAFALRGNCGVIAVETLGRKGDATVYAPWPETAWKAGQEVWISGERDTWTRIRVGSVVSWIPTSALYPLEAIEKE